MKETSVHGHSVNTTAFKFIPHQNLQYYASKIWDAYFFFTKAVFGSAFDSHLVHNIQFCRDMSDL